MLHRLLPSTSALALLAATGAAAQTVPAQAGDTASTPAGPENEQGAAGPADERNDVVVTGTRAAGRSRLDSAAPVDVLSATTLRQQGTTELAAALQAVAPSIDFPRPSAVDGTDAIRPATLRGLSPDETLVLVNGLRGHTSALLNVNGSVGRGAAAVDLNTIPTVALDRIEVLRDGASAQYGSDAIAGVVNIRLREARSGGGATVNYGFYDTQVDTARGSRHVDGEHAVSVSGWQGIGLGEGGFLTLSGEFLHREATNRADFDPRVAGAQVTGRFGDPRVEQYSLWANAGHDLGANFKLYGWFGYTDRDSRSAAFPRVINTAASAAAANAQVRLAGYPNGYLPIINTRSRDYNSALGIRGDVGGWNVDLSGSYGRNDIDLRTLNSANYAYGAATPHDFYDGKLGYSQLVGDLNVSRKFDVFRSLNVAAGLEGRREGFSIGAGELASYGPPPTGAVAGAAQGAQGFGGFSPLNALSRHRNNGSVYLDLEAEVTDKLLVGLAGRGEHYSDFGDTGTGKGTIRYDFTRWFALRGAVSTGFRAPALQQQYFTSIASVIQNGAPVLTGTFPSTSAVARALGGLPLQPERSTNFSAGTVIRAGGFDLTVDGYLIKLRDQLGLSENLAGSAVSALLAPTGTGATAARFFINGIASTTKGIDAVAHYRARTPSAGVFDFTVAGNLNHVEVTRVPTTTSTLNPAPTLFARSRIFILEQGTPGEKVTGSVEWALDRLGATARVTHYGQVNQPGTAPDRSADVLTGRHAITDLEVRYAAAKGANIGLGVSNLFDVYPDRTVPANNTTGVVGFPYFSPFGFNGRYLYARVGVNW